jgi:hypothetical protein
MAEGHMVDPKADDPESAVPVEERSAKAPSLFTKLIFATFAWTLVGICLIYGVRMWFNSTVPPSFLPITGAAFCAVLSFALVLALEYATGRIKIKFSTVDFEGASGPIILWCLCFFVIALGLYMLGIADAVKATAPGDSRSLSWSSSAARAGEPA